MRSRPILYSLGLVALGGTLGLLHTAKVHAASRALARDDHHAMAGHMTMTTIRTAKAGDQKRADAVVVAAKAVADQYLDFHKALADGYKIFLPEAPQKVYHFTQDRAGFEAAFRFDPDKPTSLLYERTSKPGEEPAYKLVGVMYTDRFGATDDELDQRIPLSIAQWHLHTNLCLPPKGETIVWKGPEAKFGLEGSITTEAACKAAGGKFMPHLFGWMVHVYPYETDPTKVWSAGMDDDHGMEHDAMPGMKMGPGDKM